MKSRPFTIFLGALLLQGVITSASPESKSSTLIEASAHRTITTRSTYAQEAFDRGLLALYAFNIGEARSEFQRATELDPNCAMAWWGEAISEVTDINVVPDSNSESRGLVAIVRAGNAPEASADERQLIAALTQRFEPAFDVERRKSAYANAMHRYTIDHAQDADAFVQASFAIWNAGFHGAPTIAKDIESALALEPNNVGAHHLAVHYWEESGQAQRGLVDADWLMTRSYRPGLSHLPHMAAHIYGRLGQFSRVIQSSTIALANDDLYFALSGGAGQVYMQRYHDHDLAYLLYALTTIGEFRAAKAAAVNEDANMRASVALRSHDWRAVIDSGTQVQYFLGIAYGWLGSSDQARNIIKSLESTRMSMLPTAIDQSGTSYDDYGAEIALIKGASARARGDNEEAVSAYAEAYALRRQSPGDPKFFWHTPIGECYGAALLRAGFSQDAERIFETEVGKYPGDPHLLFGLAESRRLENKDDSAARLLYRANWGGSKDLTLSDLG